MSRMTQDLLPALSRFPRFWSESLARRIVVFLDYDGTLTPIAPTPDLAVLAPETWDVLRALASRTKVAIISGRDLDNVRRMVGLETLWYAGSHGFDMAGPGGETADLAEGGKFLPDLDAAEAACRSRCAAVAGCLVERKKYALAVHYRQVAPEETENVLGAFEEIAREYPALRATSGKMVRELVPDIDWDKGQAVLRLLELWHADNESTLPIYIGDDLTDENAFRALSGRGLGILVRDGEERPTEASMALNDVREVRRFLGDLAAML